MTKKEHLAMVWEKRYTVTPISPDFIPVYGMEGPYQYANGRVLHFDPREQKYYDRTQDLYLSDREAEELREKFKKIIKDENDQPNDD